MKIASLLRKDLAHQFRSAFALFMMLAAPLLITGLLYAAFGGLGKKGAPAIQKTRVAVANLDRPHPDATALGAVFAAHLEDGALADLLAVTPVPDEPSARAAVDARSSDAAVIIPPEFSAAVLAPGVGPTATVLLYRDPTLTFGPAVVRTILAAFLDGLVGARLSVRLAADQLAERGARLTEAAARGIAERYVLWSGQARVMETRPPDASAGAEGELQAINKAVMSSMLIFFVFFTGASAAQSLVTEQEEGTLARLAATPTRAAAIIAGKSLSAVVLLVVQVAVLLLASTVLFGIRWGKPGPLAISAVSLILAAAGFGLLLMGLVRSSRQVGLVLGMGMSVTGMLGGLFTHFIPGIPSYLDQASLAVPQGWAVRLWKLTLAGAPLRELLLPAGVLAGIGILCFTAGVLLQRRRFA